ncbi:NADH:ubiquinone oxidoreductase [Bizionia arctica]|uniref:NADH:ubiquinone oxidoreductase n=2 Tax=Bizionia arctica TaxID=1495645 RepID=A0A917LNL8_9FLAO|nr:NADH:ubiquinone oxidoreductase [Bizionia arctica]
MGGASEAKFLLNKDGFGEFLGHVSLENNGGFASVKYQIGAIEVDEFQKIQVKIKGDTLKYQLRLKTNKSERHSYVSYFETNGEWQTLELPLHEFYPTYRGRALELPKYPGKFLEELGFLIANKKDQNFKLEIEQISLI